MLSSHGAQGELRFETVRCVCRVRAGMCPASLFGTCRSGPDCSRECVCLTWVLLGVVAYSLAHFRPGKQMTIWPNSPHACFLIQDFSGGCNSDKATGAQRMRLLVAMATTSEHNSGSNKRLAKTKIINAFKAQASKL